MGTQDKVNELTAQVEQAKTTIVTKIEEETQQVKEFIDAHPEIDTSALESAVAGLSSIGDSVDSIMADAAPAPDPALEG